MKNGSVADAAGEAVDAVDVVVIGAGVAGLQAAGLLHARGHSVVVLEGRSRVGGRLLSIPVDGVGIDLGATWFWSNEPQINELIEANGLPVFPQYLQGDAMFESDQGIQRMQGNPIDAASGRIVAGAQAIAHALEQRLPTGTVKLDQRVISVTSAGDALTVQTVEASWRAHHVVVAVPPATAVGAIDFAGELPRQVHALAAATPVWMGSTVKVVVQYPRAFWREHGLAGAAFSHVGPLREIHDMSGPDGTPAAVFGFAQPGIGNAAPTGDQVLEQLVGLFGAQGDDAERVFIQDWRAEPMTSPPNVDELTQYQTYGHRLFTEPALGGRLHWASTETASVAPGHIEGALQAGTRAATAVAGDLSQRAEHATISSPET